MTQLARVGIIKFGGHQTVTEVDSLVFKASVACLLVKTALVYGQCVSFV